jgi:hypothetical protein
MPDGAILVRLRASARGEGRPTSERAGWSAAASAPGRDQRATSFVTVELERLRGVEPRSSPWQGDALPLCYNRRAEDRSRTGGLARTRGALYRAELRRRGTSGGGRTRTGPGLSRPPLPLGYRGMDRATDPASPVGRPESAKFTRTARCRVDRTGIEPVISRLRAWRAFHCSDGPWRQRGRAGLPRPTPRQQRPPPGSNGVNGQPPGLQPGALPPELDGHAWTWTRSNVLPPVGRGALPTELQAHTSGTGESNPTLPGPKPGPVTAPVVPDCPTPQRLSPSPHRALVCHPLWNSQHTAPPARRGHAGATGVEPATTGFGDQSSSC